MSELQVQIVEGRAWEPTRTFTTGTPVGPLGLGSAGEWVMDGQNVAPVHAYIYFDGTALMMATAAPHVTTVNGAPIGADWMPVPIPCEVRLGEVRLQVQDSSAAAAGAGPAAAPQEIEDAATGYFERPLSPGAPLPAGAAAMAPAPAAGRRPPPTDESTAYRPIEQFRKEGLANPPAPAAGGPSQPAVIVAPETIRQPLDPSKIAATIAPGLVPAPQIEPPPGMFPPGAPGAPGAQPGAPGAQAAQSGGVAAIWKSAPLPRKLIYVLMPVALIGFAITMLGDDEAPPAPKNTKASGKASASAPASAMPPPLPAVGAAASMPTGALLPAPPRSAYKPPLRPPLKPPPASVERKAVDAVINGNYPEAIAIYEQLAQQYPDVPAYKEAIRILKAKQAAAGK